MNSYTLGLDIGSNSIGWALLKTQGKPTIIDIGVRVFPKGVGREKENEKTKCAERREARGARRVHRRRKLRRDELVKILRENKLLPKDKESLQELLKSDPYQLRAKGLGERLELFEFGRALFHINQRRGFKSNRKTGEANEKSKIAKGDKEHKGANEIAKVIDERKFRTIGEYFGSIDTTKKRIRGQYTFRSMYEREFGLLWEEQSKYYRDILTKELRKKIKDEVIFYQRPVRWDPETIGYCELEDGEKRCPRGNWYARRFRILQDVNNMKIRNADGSEIEITDKQRSIVLKELGKKKKVNFERLRKELSKQDSGLIEKQRFNFEEDGDNNWMNGDGFSEQMRSKKLLGPKGWENLEKKTRIAVNQAVLDLCDKDLKEKAINEFGFNKEQSAAFLEVTLERNYMRYSKKAILKLLPYMEKGLKTHQAKEEAGYKEGSEKIEQSSGGLPRPDDLRNPIVTAALNEVRRLVNRMVGEYDKPKNIVIEMARELKNTKLARKRTLEKNRKNQKLNEEAKSWIKEHTSIKSPRYEDILKYKLWIECNKSCLYTGKSISPTDLFESPVFQIEHILPHERSGDDSYMNKTLCYVDENVHVKGGKTPFEAYHGKPEKYEEIRQRITCLPQPKKERFLQEEIQEGHIERELNDTRYITKETIKYLKKLGVLVRGTRGTATGLLRHNWGLDNIFEELATRRDDDHRRHAVDAVIVGVTTSKHLHDLARTRYSKVDRTFPPPENWPDFREELEEKVRHINVSHRANRKVSGALHEEMNYGPTGCKDVKGQDVFVYRKKLEDLTGPMVAKIADPVVREIVTERLAEHGIDAEKDKKIPNEVWVEPVYMKTKKSDRKVPIKKVRIRGVVSNAEPIQDRDGKAYRYVKPGSNHHVEIWEYTGGEKQGTRDAEVVSMFEAVRRSRAGEHVVKREHGANATFICSLAINDMVMLPVGDEQMDLFRVQRMSVIGQIYFRGHTAARIDDDSTLIRRQAHLFDGYKVVVDCLGRVHRAND